MSRQWRSWAWREFSHRYSFFLFFFQLLCLNSGPILEPLHQPFFEIGSPEVVAWADLKLWSSWSLLSWVSRIAGVSH
jgi:hypothetical protein